MMRALHKEKLYKMLATVHQLQQYHLDTYINGMTSLGACKYVGMDAAIQYFEAMGRFWVPNTEKYIVQTPQWKRQIDIIDASPNNKILHYTITTPKGKLTYKTGGKGMCLLNYP